MPTSSIELRSSSAKQQQRLRGKHGRIACDFCRKRKIRCDNSIPCSACIRANQQETCTVTLKKNKRALPLLQQESLRDHYQTRSPSINRSERDDLNRSSTASNDGREIESYGSTPISSRNQTNASINQLSNIGEEVGRARYHGPTSASFHDLHNENDSFNATSTNEVTNHHNDLLSNNITNKDLPNQTIRQSSSIGERRQLKEIELPSDEYLSPIITANAAHQQHAEIANVVSGKLDFDGIEPELTMHLLSLHWNRQHHAFLVTYRPLFMRDMAAGSSGRYFSKLLLHAILFGASKFSDRIDQLRGNPNDPSSAGLMFQKRIEILLPEALMISRITTVQSLLLLACTHFARGDESAAWLHSGLAFRMASDLGLFVSDCKFQVAKEQIAPEELELRRRVAWAAYTIDKIHSLYQGRQVSIRHVDIGVPAVFLDTFEEQEYWTPIAYQSREKVNMFGCPIYSVSTFTQLCKLTIILEQIIETLYGVKSVQNSKKYLLTELDRLHQCLSDWFYSLPGHLRMNFRTIQSSLNNQDLGSPNNNNKNGKDVRSPNVISLNALYHCLVILLNRPFLPYGHLYDRVVDGMDTSENHQEDRSGGLLPIARTAWKACVDAAMQISHLMSLYRRNMTMRGAPQLISYINFCAAGIHVRLAAQVGAQSDGVQRQMSKEALRALRSCLEDFEENEHSNPGVAKANNVIRRMARHFSINPDRIDECSQDSNDWQKDQTGGQIERGINNRPISDETLAGQSGQIIAVTPSRDVFDRNSRSEGIISNSEIMNTNQFDLNAFLSTFDDLNEPFDEGNMGGDVMFGFLKDMLGEKEMK